MRGRRSTRLERGTPSASLCPSGMPKNPIAPHNGGIVLYDFLHCLGGAEQLTLTLLKALPGTDLCIGYRNSRLFPSSGIAAKKLHDLHLPARFLGGRTMVGLVAFRLQTRFLRDYNWALFSGSVSLEGVHRRRCGRNIYYCHTLPRFAYDLLPYYAGRVPLPLRPLLYLVAAVVRRRFVRALSRMNLIIANSKNVRQRLQHYIGCDACVIYPPCDTEGFLWRGQEDFYLSTARLEPYKRVDSVIEAFRRMPHHRLILVSGGSDEVRLRRLAADAANIQFCGWVSAERLRDLVGRCIATVYVSQVEDFGISPVESMAVGKPVIGVAEGGLPETVIHETTGILTPPDAPLVPAVVAAVERLTPARAVSMRMACERRAQDFGEERFSSAMREVIATVTENADPA